jgi:arylsulfatase A-like enzyme
MKTPSAFRLCLAYALIGLCAPLELSADQQPPANPPNFVVILTDNQRFDTIAALGNPVIRTPNLDRLVRGGTTFTRAVAYPLCTPSRTEMITGCSALRTGVVGFSQRPPKDLAFWPAVMRDRGYETWHIGKWHIVGEPSEYGYSQTGAMVRSGGPRTPPLFGRHGREITGYRNSVFSSNRPDVKLSQPVALTADIDRYFADSAIEVIEQKPARPYFLHVNFTAGHDPYLTPDGFEPAYDPAKIPLPPNFLPEHPFDHGNLRGRDELLLPWPRTPEMIREGLAYYYAELSYMDQQVGRILTALEKTDQMNNTIVIFSSDHGRGLGSHGIVGYHCMYEHSISAPIIFFGQGIPAGVTQTAQCYLRDLFPTVCELSRTPVPATVEGRSLVPVLQGQADKIYDYVFGGFQRFSRMVRSDRWKYIYYPQIDKAQLFDLQSDPHEIHDLAAARAHAQVAADLRTRLLAWMRDNKDAVLNQDN